MAKSNKSKKASNSNNPISNMTDVDGLTSATNSLVNNAYSNAKSKTNSKTHKNGATDCR